MKKKNTKPFELNLWVFLITVIIFTSILFVSKPAIISTIVGIIIVGALSVIASIASYKQIFGFSNKVAIAIISIMLGIIFSSIINIVCFLLTPIENSLSANSNSVMADEPSGSTDNMSDVVIDTPNAETDTTDDNINSDTKSHDVFLDVAPVEIESFTKPDDIKQELNINSNEIFNPSIGEEFLNKLYFPDNLENAPSDVVVSEIQIQIEIIRNNFNNIMNSTNLANNNSIEYNKSDYEELTILANDIDRNMTKENSDAGKYRKKIECRETAYKMYKTRALSLLLARDYYELGHHYVKTDIKQEALNCYIKSLEYYSEAISLMKKDEKYCNDEFDVYYLMGQVYHSIGDLKYLEKQIKIKSYLMSMCYLQISSEDDNKERFNSMYYCGMLNHKLGLMFGESRYIFLMNAEKHYCNCQTYPTKELTKRALQSFSADVYDELCNYSKIYGQKGPMLSMIEYKQKGDTARSTSKKLLEEGFS